MAGKRGGGFSKNIALGGIFSALAVLIMLFGGYISIGTFAAPIFAGLCLVPIAAELGKKWAILCYIAVSVVSATLVADTELVIFYIALLGYYPILQPHFAKIKNTILRFAAKLVLFNTVLAAVYWVLLFVFASPALQDEFAKSSNIFIGVLLVLANITFILYDIMLCRVCIIYANIKTKRR